MTNREFFVQTLDAEAPVFIKVIKAMPKNKASFKPHAKARTAESLVSQLSGQPAWISRVVTVGAVDFSEHMDKKQKSDSSDKMAERNFQQLKENLAKISDADWENTDADMLMGGKSVWQAKKSMMAWQLLFDMIHHRGQLSTYIRISDGKVPSIYGGSADERSGA